MEAAVGKKKTKKTKKTKSKPTPAAAAPDTAKAIAKAAAAKNKKANEKKAAAAEKKKKNALSLPDDDENQEIDLVAKMEAARRAMPNAFVVSQAERRGGTDVACFWCQGPGVLPLLMRALCTSST